MSASYQIAALQISRVINIEKASLENRERYYRFILNNVNNEMRRIELELLKLREERKRIVRGVDIKILELEEEKEKIVGQFEVAPRIIEEIQQRLKGLDSKRDKLLIEPKIDRFMMLRQELIREGVEV